MTFKRKSFIPAGVIVFFVWCNKNTLGAVDRATGFTAANNRGFSDVGSDSSSKKILRFQPRGGARPEKQADGSQSVVCSSNSSALEGISQGGSIVEGKDPRDAVEEDESGDSVRSGPSSIDSDARTTTGLSEELRLQGKEAHDKGDFVAAAEIFRKAADALYSEDPRGASEEHATCRLHQALCHLKSEDYTKCLEACTDVLEESGAHSSAVRARAYHRRAKAKLALDDQIGALQDARSAAFLGDRKAVALYGRLMRGSSSLATSEGDSASGEWPTSPTSPSAALFESLLSKSSAPVQSGTSPMSSLFGANGFGKNGIFDALTSGNAAGEGGIAKSLFNSMVKRLEDEKTHTTISTFFQATDKVQLQQYASLAGISIPESYLDRIEGICHGITPRTIKRTVVTTKGAIYAARILRRISRLLQKYKSLIIALALFQWTKSAILRPIPIDRAVKRSTKAALKDAMKANRPGESP